MVDAPPKVQAIRSININSISAPPRPEEIVYVDTYSDPVTNKEFMLWEDIRLAFYNALHVRHEARPFRIAVIPSEVLDIVVGNPQDNTTTPQQHQQAQKQQLSILKQIERQAALLPRHDPFATLQPHHLSSSVYNSRFEPAGKTFILAFNNQPSSTGQRCNSAAADRARNKELALMYAKEAMTKIATTMNLIALHAKGEGAPKDFWKALECYLTTVRHGHAHAQVNVGDLFLEGRGVSQSSSVAMGWYQNAACQGNTKAKRIIEAIRP
ncbi:hypothetical protein BGZ95_009826 [Linnemannia exigua]|uniref:HCP-like protein n=1 Tax=Linnemannia exigua TaxID=604196 RepID=A0AAD4DML0_9FUNG|nr:hypothetical protein BGZ95_009826 [Linnemannia exigua]